MPCRTVGASPRCTGGPGLAGALLFLGGLDPHMKAVLRLVFEVLKQAVDQLVGGERQHQDDDHHRGAKDGKS
jgi:hypothetical protein